MKTNYIHATIITGDDNNTIIEDGMIVVSDNMIEYVGDIIPYDSDKTYDCKGNILMPGLVNGCVKLGQYTIASDIHSLPELERELSSERLSFDKQDISLQAEDVAKRMLREGVTTLFDYSGFGDVCVPCYNHAGIRSWVAVGLFEEGEVKGKEQLVNEQIDVTTLLSTPFLYSNETYTLTDEQLMPLVEQLREGNVLHMPLHRSLVDIGQCLKETGYSPVAFLDDLGLLGFSTHLLYGTCMDKEDMFNLKNADTSVTLCPVEDMYLGYGMAPILSYIRQNIPLLVGTGIDAFAHPSMQDTIRALYMMACSQFHDPNVLEDKQVFAMCTKNYEKYRIGVLQKGYFADILLVDKVAINPLADIIHFENGEYLNIRNLLMNMEEHLLFTMVDGKIVFNKV